MRDRWSSLADLAPQQAVKKYASSTKTFGRYTLAAAKSHQDFHIQTHQGITMAPKLSKKEMDITSPSSDSDSDAESQVSIGSAGEEGSDAELSGSDNDSDSLDSDTPRKKRKVSVDVEVDPVDDEPYHAGIISSIAAPSRVGRKGAAPAPAPAAPALSNFDLEADTTPANVPLELDTSFESLGLRPWLIQSLSNMAIRRPTKIQKETIPQILMGKDCIGGSRTGSGKTVAFATPILQRLAEDPSCIFAVVLTATRYVMKLKHPT